MKLRSSGIEENLEEFGGQMRDEYDHIYSSTHKKFPMNKCIGTCSKWELQKEWKEGIFI